MADPLVSVEEIKQHASENDCWIVIDDVVWDITEFIPQHPGGNESKYLVNINIKIS
jgi:L-lactate dehydrogenase (cytochrome)